MKILVVSDIHYETGENSFFHGVDESNAFYWLMHTVRVHNPDCLIGLGDFGNGWTEFDWQKLVGKVYCKVIYGNHDNVEALKSVTSAEGLPVNPPDGSIISLSKYKFGFINGIMSSSPFRKGVPRKTLEAYMQYATKFKDIDFVCSHMSPYLEEYGDYIHPDKWTIAVNSFIDVATPKYWLGGHLTYDDFSFAKMSDSSRTTVIRVDSSQSTKTYAIIDTDFNSISIYKDGEELMSKQISNLF